MSSAVDRATSVKALPVAGVTFSKYSPLAGGVQAPPIEFS